MADDVLIRVCGRGSFQRWNACGHYTDSAKFSPTATGGSSLVTKNGSSHTISQLFMWCLAGDGRYM